MNFTNSADIKIGTNIYTPHQDQSNQRLSKRQAHKLSNYSSIAFVDDQNHVIVDGGPFKPSTGGLKWNRAFQCWRYFDNTFKPSININRGKWNDWQLPTMPRGSYPGTHNKR